MYSGGRQREGDEDDVKRVEGFIEVVSEKPERRGDQDCERDERLTQRSVWVQNSDDKTQTYNPTPDEWWIKPRVDICGPAGDWVLGRGKLNTPTHNVDNGDEIYESANPTVGDG